MACCLQVENLTKSFGDLVLFENISFAIEDGRRVALVAKNGTGKTTLLNIIAGREDHDGGSVVPRRDLRIAYLEQSPVYPAEMTVLEACFLSENPALKAIAEYERAIEEPSGEGLQEAMARMDALEAWDYEQRAKRILSRLKIRDFGQRVGTLSGGQLKRVALANVLISESDLLILDEPTNHLDTDMTEWLEEYLTASGAGLLMVTHDRYFLDKVCSDILEIEDRQLYHYAGNYSYYLEKKQERETAQAARRESETNLYRRELEWMRRQPQARATKARSRIDAFHELEARLQSTRSRGEVRLDVKASRIGTKIFEAKEVGKRFGELVLLDKFNYNFTRYEKLGIVGDNGCGKSTFLKLLTGIERPDSGTIEVGETVRFGYYSQQGLEFDEGKRVIDVVTEIAEQIDLGDGRRMSASQFLQHFLFTPETQYSFVARLSGGERRRLYLCTVLMRNPNFLILDEPTNDLDIVTLGILEEYLRAFKGCVIVVSHDRYFVDKVADHLLVFCGGGEIKDFTGTYSEYVAWKREYEAARHAQEAQARPKPQAVRTQAAETAPRKLSYNEKRELETLEREILALEAEKAALEESLSSGSLGVDELTAQSQRRRADRADRRKDDALAPPERAVVAGRRTKSRENREQANRARKTGGRKSGEPRREKSGKPAAAGKAGTGGKQKSAKNRTRMEERVTGRRRQNEDPDKRKPETGRKKSGKPAAAGKAGTGGKQKSAKGRMPPEGRKTEAKETGRLINDNGGAFDSAVVVLSGFGRRIWPPDYSRLSSVRFSRTVCWATRWRYSACSGGRPIVQSVW